VVDAEVIKALQIIALQAAEDPSDEQFYRRVCRWYSEKYSTSLHVVEEMDYYYVLQHYFEDNYHQLESSDDKDVRYKYEEIKARLIYPEEFKKHEQADDDWVKQLEAEAMADEEKANKSNTLVSETAKPADELNLPDGFKLPDSGSYSE
jgi:hypothetical protein